MAVVVGPPAGLSGFCILGRIAFSFLGIGLVLLLGILPRRTGRAGFPIPVFLLVLLRLLLRAAVLSAPLLPGRVLLLGGLLAGLLCIRGLLLIFSILSPIAAAAGTGGALLLLRLGFPNGYGLLHDLLRAVTEADGLQNGSILLLGFAARVPFPEMGAKSAGMGGSFFFAFPLRSTAISSLEKIFTVSGSFSICTLIRCRRISDSTTVPRPSGVSTKESTLGLERIRLS